VVKRKNKGGVFGVENSFFNQFSLKNKTPNKYYKNILKPLNNPKTSQDNPKKYENQLNENSLN